MRNLAGAQYWDRPADGDTGHLFLAFGGPVCVRLATVHWIGCINAIKMFLLTKTMQPQKLEAVQYKVKKKCFWKEKHSAQREVKVKQTMWRSMH